MAFAIATIFLYLHSYNQVYNSWWLGYGPPYTNQTTQDSHTQPA